MWYTTTKRRTARLNLGRRRRRRMWYSKNVLKRYPHTWPRQRLRKFDRFFFFFARTHYNEKVSLCVPRTRRVSTVCIIIYRDRFWSLPVRRPARSSPNECIRRVWDAKFTTTGRTHNNDSRVIPEHVYRIRFYVLRVSDKRNHRARIVYRISHGVLGRYLDVDFTVTYKR